jgi:hypothetical protein
VRWYTLPGWPARVLGHAAAMPTLTRAPGSWEQYKDGVTGWPGTRAVPVSGPGVLTGPITLAMGGYSFTANCPGHYPNLYWARPQGQYWPGAGMPVSVASDNLMPVPATDPRSVNAPLQVPLNLQGAKQIKQPATLIQWPSVNG